MLTFLGVATIAALLALILFRLTSVFVALALVPVVAALAGGFWRDVGDFALEGIRGVVPVASLLAFAVLYFGVMNDAGLFAPIIRNVVRLVRGDPVRLTVATAAIAMVSHLDGAGASTFMVTVPAMLPLYTRMGMSPLTLTCITALAAGTMNLLPWAGPTTRAAAALHVTTADVFVPVVPAMLVGLATVFGFAVLIGRGERRRRITDTSAPETSGQATSLAADPATATTSALGWRWYFNATMTVVLIAALFSEIMPLAVVFIVGAAVAVLVNYPDAALQRDRILAHSSAAMLMVTTIFAAGVFTGILTRSGMLSAMAADAVRMLPNGMLSHVPILMAVTSMPLSLMFDPDSFYFGLLPVVAGASTAAGGASIEVARAAVLGQMTTGFPVSPLTPSTFLLVGLAGVDLGDHQRRTIGYALAITLIMTVTAVLTGAIRL